jgi:hypothetical protein
LHRGWGGKKKHQKRILPIKQHKPKTNRRDACRTKKPPPQLTIHAVPHAPPDAVAADTNDENVHTQDQDGPVQRSFSVQFVILLFAMAATFGNELNRMHHLGTNQTGHHTKIGCAMQRTQQKRTPHKKEHPTRLDATSIKKKKTLGTPTPNNGHLPMPIKAKMTVNVLPPSVPGANVP